MRAFLIAAVALLLPALAAAQERTILAVVLNTLPQEDAFVLTTSDGTWMAVGDLEAMGLTGFAGRRQTFDDVEHVLLSSLAPRLTTAINTRDLSIELIASPELFPPVQFTAVPTRPAGLQYVRSFSSFANYRLLWNSDGGLTGSADAGMNVAGHSLRSSGTFSESGHFTRGLSTLTFDAPSKRVRVELGDVTARWSGGLSGGTLVGGITIGRDNSLDPYYQQYHVPAFEGAATLPSTAELYVNGMLQRTFDLNPGSFRIDGLPVTAGRGDILVRVRDSLGQVVDLGRNYYLATQLLGAGRHDFRLTAGLKRQDTGRRTTYRDWAFVVGHRVGVTEGLTLGTFAEGDKNSVAGGIGFGVGAPWLGELSVDGAVSRETAGGALGYAAAGAWSLSAKHMSFSMSGHWMSGRYYGLESNYRDRVQPWSARAFIGVPLGGFGSIFLEGAVQDLFEIVLPPNGFELPEITESRITRVGGRLELRLLSRLNLRGGAGWNRNLDSGQRYWDGSVGLVLSPGARVSVSAEAVRDRERDTVFTDISRPLPRANGIGFRLRSVGPVPITASTHRIQGQLDVQHSFARASVTHERDFSGNSSTGAYLEGGLVQVGSAIALSRPVNSSFVMVQVPRVKGVTVYRDHDPVGRTGRSGRFLVPELQAYYGNLLSIEDTDLPLDLLVNETRAVVAPPFRGGAILRFPVTLIRAYMGTVRLEPWPSDVARYGTIFFRREGVELVSPLGSDGSFYLDKAEAGRYDVEIEMGDATCRTIADLPRSDTLTTAVGEIVCRVQTQRSSS